jgi:hypothetical protein
MQAKRFSEVPRTESIPTLLNQNRFTYLNDGLGDPPRCRALVEVAKTRIIRQLRAKRFLEYLRHMDCSAFGAPRVVSSLLRLGTNGPVDGAIKRDQYAPPLRENRKVPIGIDRLTPSWWVQSENTCIFGFENCSL